MLIVPCWCSDVALDVARYGALWRKARFGSFEASQTARGTVKEIWKLITNLAYLFRRRGQRTVPLRHLEG